MWTDLAAWTLRFAPWGFLAGLFFALAGLIGVIVFRRRDVTMGPVPHKLTAPPKPPWAPGDMYRTGGPVTGSVPTLVDERDCVMPRIPGATPEAGPVCPICGGPFHSPCPSAPKERTEEEAAFNACIAVIDEAAHLTEELMHAVAAKLRDNCPLTTQEIPPLDPALPVYAGIASREPTRDLSAALEKVRQA